MEGIQKGIAQHWGKAFVALIVLAIIVAYTSISSMDEEAQDLVLEFFQDYLPLCMFVTLALLLFSGFPVAFILGGLAFLYGILGYFLDMFSLIEFFNFVLKSWSGSSTFWGTVSIEANLHSLTPEELILR